MVEEGVAVPLTSSTFIYTDEENSPIQSYVIAGLPDETGVSVDLNGSALMIGQTFTQEDLDNGNVTINAVDAPVLTDSSGVLSVYAEATDGTQTSTASLLIDFIKTEDAPSLSITPVPALLEGDSAIGSTRISTRPWCLHPRASCAARASLCTAGTMGSSSGTIHACSKSLATSSRSPPSLRASLSSSCLIGLVSALTAYSSSGKALSVSLCRTVPHRTSRPSGMKSSISAACDDVRALSTAFARLGLTINKADST